MLCTHKTTILCQFGLFCHKLTTISPPILSNFWWELYQINKSHCSTPKLTSRIKSSIQRELLIQNKFLNTPTSGFKRTRRIVPVIQGTFAAIEQAENYLPLQPFFNNTHFGQTLINCIHNQHRIGIPDEYFVETCINTYTKNGFVTKEFVKIDEDSQTQDYTIVYIRFQGQTPPFSTHNRDIFESLLPTPFPQVGDIFSEEEYSESEQELIA